MADVNTDVMLEKMRSEVIAAAVRIGVSPRVARILASSIESRMELLHGGREGKAKRNSWIRHDFNGCNHDEVCERYEISRRTLYRVLNNEVD